MLSSRTFDLSVKADTFSFNSFIILFFSSRSFSYLSNLSVINLTDFERSASDCSPLIYICLFRSTKLCIVLTSFSKFFKQFKRIPLQSSLSTSLLLNTSHSSVILEAEVVSLSSFLALRMF